MQTLSPRIEGYKPMNCHQRINSRVLGRHLSGIALYSIQRAAYALRENYLAYGISPYGGRVTTLKTYYVQINNRPSVPIRGLVEALEFTRFWGGNLIANFHSI